MPPVTLTLGTPPDAAGVVLAAGYTTAVGRLDAAGWDGPAALLASPGLRAVRDALGEARARLGAMPLTLVIDARTPALAGLDWEALEAAPERPWHPLRVARLLPGPLGAPPAAADRLDLRVWVPDGADRVAAGVLAGLGRGLSGDARVALQAHGAPTPPRLARGDRPALHLLGGGAALGAAVERLLAAGAAAAVGLLVLDRLDDAPSPAPGALLAAGVGAVAVGRPGRTPEAVLTGALALHAALGRGVGPAAAAAIGRARGGGTALWVADPERLDRPLVRPEPLPGDWPTPGEEGRAVLLDAAGLARGQGYLGIEHVAHALTRLDPAPPGVAEARHGLLMVAGMLPGTTGRDPPLPSPRLTALAAALPEGFDAEALLRAIAPVPWVAERIGHALAARLVAQTSGPRRAPEAAGEAGAALVLEAVAGPDDGRRFVLDRPGQVIGRADAETSLNPDVVSLFAGARAADLSVSRRHLVYRGGRTVEALGYTRLERSGQVVEVRGPVDVLPGDRLWVGAGTRLLVR